ncbi:MAG: class I SAM-dependent methyltransferase [Gammaproteobacteria bacterium]|nr:class I SAM-dependent methyltransferase [Gammaproteobacteria bacterium]MBU0785577.1 class I SAM-dependent methyltransferase [Gammaproteobacteria bacterium]MBU0816865.1 class I SAM-dependent methyltransferase [Gammaproteobacteria bacterium]MBU1787029.1 class I SAM-dependent methyltransferase [Gammaproteobacteria bacterium]
MSSSWYDRFILPRALDIACGLPMIGRQRVLVVPLAQGRVLEIGVGTGLNMRYYDKARVSRITALDPALELHPLARERIAQAGLEVELLGLSAEQIPLPEASFDTVLMTYTLCTIPDPLAALREMRRVLAPGGRLLYCEHGRAPDASVRRWQERLQPLWGPLAGGCHLGRDIPALLKEAGFKLPDLHTRYLPGPRPFTFHYWGEAVAP